MPIANRKLKPGTVLLARYKGGEHRAEVVKTKEGLRYKLKDGREFKSPSSAGVAVKGEGKTCDGWEFWSVEGAPPVLPRAKREQQASARPKGQGKPKAKRKGKAKAKTEPKAKAEKPIQCGDCRREFPNSREAAQELGRERDHKESAGRAGWGAGRAARGVSILVPIGMSSVPVKFFSLRTASIVSSVSVRSNASSACVAISGIMISGRASTCLPLQAIIASTIAVTCMTRISG